MIDIQTMFAAAAQFEPMTQIPFLTKSLVTNGGSAPEMFNALFKLSIVIGAMLAVFMFIWGGLQMITARDSAGSVGEGKKKMTNAVMGLLMLVSTFVVLNTINPQLTSLALFKGADGKDISKLKAAPRTRPSNGAQNREERVAVVDLTAKRLDGSRIRPVADGEYCYDKELVLYGKIGDSVCFETRNDCKAFADSVFGFGVAGASTCYNPKDNRILTKEETFYCRKRPSGSANCAQGHYATESACGDDCVSVQRQADTPTPHDGPYKISTGNGVLRFRSQEVCNAYNKEIISKTIGGASCEQVIQ